MTSPMERRPRPESSITLLDGRRVVSRWHQEGREWSIYVYPAYGDDRILGYGVAATLSRAMQDAGLSEDDIAAAGWR